MTKGFTLIEFMVALTLSASLLSLVVATITESLEPTKRVISHQEKMETIFHTMEMLKSDLTKCGMRLQEASQFLYFPLFENTNLSFKVIYGIGTEALKAPSLYGATSITVNKNEFFSQGRKIILFDPQSKQYEVNEIKKQASETLYLMESLLYNYPVNAIVVAIVEVEYKFYSVKNAPALKRRVNNGNFQPVIENVTDFYVEHFPKSNSVFYRLEINKREQIQGYVFMTNMMEVVQ